MAKIRYIKPSAIRNSSIADVKLESIFLKQATKVLNEIECYAQEVFQITSLNNKKIVESRSKEELDNLNLEKYPLNLHITI